MRLCVVGIVGLGGEGASRVGERPDALVVCWGGEDGSDESSLRRLI